MVGCLDNDRKILGELRGGTDSITAFLADCLEVVHMDLVGTASWGMGEHQELVAGLEDFDKDTNMLASGLQEINWFS